MLDYIAVIEFMIASIAAWMLTVLFTALTFLSLVRSDYWTFRVLEYPRLQKLVFGIICLIIITLLRNDLYGAFPWMIGIIATGCMYLLVKIFPYTPIAPKEMKSVASGTGDNTLRILTCNVYQENKQYEKLKSQIAEYDPDVIFLVETDKEWDAHMKLDDLYPYSIKKPLDNTYGVLFYSRLLMRNERVLFRAEDDVPSIEAELQLPKGEWIKIFGLHPKPPAPTESLTSTAKDKELMKVAFQVKGETLPCIVMGDLNDVAWSYTTELFRKVSRMLDPRRGRGFYSTFSAKSSMMRFPLDYIFCSSHFGLVEMKRLPANGSDHFPMFIELLYNPLLKKSQEAPAADAEEESDAMEKAAKPT